MERHALKVWVVFSQLSGLGATRLDFDQVSLTRADLPLNFRHVDSLDANSSIIVGGTDRGVTSSCVSLVELNVFGGVGNESAKLGQIRDESRQVRAVD